MLVILTSYRTSCAQDKAFEWEDESLNPRQIQLLGTENNELVIHYIQHNKATGYEAKVYKSYLVFPRDGLFKPRKIALPYSMNVKGIGYAGDFYFLIAAHREGFMDIPDGKVTIFKVDKEGISISGIMDVNMDGERDRVIFSEGGINYTISTIKKPSRIRIRRIKEFNIEVFDFPVQKEQLLSLSESVVVPQAQSEISPSIPNQKVFIRNGKIMIASRSTGATEKGGMLSLHEFPLTNPPTINTRTMIPPGTRGKFDFFPFGESMLLYEIDERGAKIDIMDMNTLKVLKSFSTDEPGAPMLKGKLCETGIFGRNNEVFRKEESEKEKLSLITRFRPWIQAWPVNDSNVKISYGDYSSKGERQQYEYVYLNLFLNPVSLEIVDQDPGPTKRQILLDQLFGERKLKIENTTTFYSKGAAFVLEFDDARNSITIWK